MNINEPLQLLGGISPKTFMQRYWHKKPLLIRQAIPGFQPLLDRKALFDLAAQEEVESRLVVQASADGTQPWALHHGPFSRKALPPLKQAGWTILVQSVDLLDDKVHALMNQFRFAPDARLDDLMISYATDTGGVGPHYDSYDVFLLQAHGQRRWRIGRQKDLTLLPDMPVKILANFEPEVEYVLEPGDMLYLPPRYAHDGIAVGECMTYSIGYRVPTRGDLAGDLLQRLAEEAGECVGSTLYRDPSQAAMENCAEIPETLLEFAKDAVLAGVQNIGVLRRVLGEHLTEPKTHVHFEGNDEEALQSLESLQAGQGLVLDRRTRMMFDAKHIFINGEGFLASGRDATLMRQLANTRTLNAAEVKRLSIKARELVLDWCNAGWLYVR
ncbi:MAG: hypothetical protein RIR79_725 [Pseudomonadota bacterium]|jgi:50S ribosomal protein L16 3-hydroxylase